MTTREEAHALLDRLSENDLATVILMLRGLTAPEDPLIAFLESRPEEDEEETEEERAAVAEAWESVDRGELTPLEEFSL